MTTVLAECCSEFFCPSAVIGFLEQHLWDSGYLLLPPQRLEALD